MCGGEKKDSKAPETPGGEQMPDAPPTGEAPAEGGDPAAAPSAPGLTSQGAKTGSQAGKSKAASAFGGTSPSIGLTSKAGAKNAVGTTPQSQVGKQPSIALQTNVQKGGTSKAAKS